jgi:hypothetical protein
MYVCVYLCVYVSVSTDVVPMERPNASYPINPRYNVHYTVLDQRHAQGLGGKALTSPANIAKIKATLHSVRAFIDCWID